MPQLSRHYCTKCGESVFNCMIDGKRVPLVLYFVVGQPPDTGEPLDVNAVALPSFVREIMQTAVARVELCMKCAADVFGVPLVDAASDPMYDVNNDKIPDALQLRDPKMSSVERAKREHFRVLHAIAVGQGKARAADLPPEYRAPEPPKVPNPDAMPGAQLQGMSLDQLRAEIARREAAIAESTATPPAQPTPPSTDDDGTAEPPTS